MPIMGVQDSQICESLAEEEVFECGPGEKQQQQPSKYGDYQRLSWRSFLAVHDYGQTIANRLKAEWTKHREVAGRKRHADAQL